jgi:hypothetical protein
MIILAISIIISLILIHEMFKINNEIDAKNEIISYLKKEVIQNIKNNLELNDKKYIILNLHNKLKKEIEIKNKLKRLFTRKEMILTSKSEIFKQTKYKYPCKLKRCHSI